MLGVLAAIVQPWSYLPKIVLVVVGVSEPGKGMKLPLERRLGGLDGGRQPGEPGEHGDVAGREASGGAVGGDARGAGLDHVLREDAQLLPHREVAASLYLMLPSQRPWT